MDIAQRSNLLFGRNYALRIYIVVAALSKSDFTTGEVRALSGVEGPHVSRELKRLSSLGFIENTSHRGDYLRHAGPFWTFISEINEEWNDDG